MIAAGEVVQGVRLLTAGLAARDAAGTPLPPGERFDVDRALAAAAEALDATVLEQAMDAGRALGLEEALELSQT